MRDFQVTSEPGVSRQTSKSNPDNSALPFVIQKHAATRLHYDFRLGWNGVLKSWAVAKGPSYFPGDKRLAVQVEDHPIEYGGFEGIIPKGQYGGGSVMVWDQGTWEPHVDVDEGLKKGNLKFTLYGEKLKGNWVLVRMNGRMAGKEKPNWLLIKEHDDYERGPNEKPITDEAPDSVVTGRDMDAIAKAEDHVWNGKGQESNHSSHGRKATPAAKTSPITHAESVRSSPAPLHNLKNAPKEKLPAFIEPQLAVQAKSPPRGDGWLHEVKLDGYRIEARVQHTGKHSVQLFTRTGLDWTHRMKSIADDVNALPVKSALFDGEVVVLNQNGVTSFADLQAAFQDKEKKPLTYFVFDLLHLNGHNLRNLALEERKNILAGILSGTSVEDSIRLSEHLEGNADILLKKICELGAEGIISKRASGKYTAGRGSAWLKLKCYREQELVIGGFTLPSNGTHGVGALLLGYYRQGKLIYAGRTGTGFTQKTHRMIRDRLEKLRRNTSPFLTIPVTARGGALWVTPELVAQISFSNWTADDLVRQAAFKGLREDKPASEVVREEEIDISHDTSLRKAKDAPASNRSRTKTGKVNISAMTDTPQDDLPIRLTHPDKILDTESGVTKEDLARYFSAVSSWMLPHIADRPLSLVRCPEGDGKPCFFQKHKNQMLPDDIGSVDIVDKKTGKPEPYITLRTPKALIELAQIGVLEVHTWGSCNGSIEKPDRIVFDLDPSDAIEWKALAASALEVRRRLKRLGLESFVKSTGGKGLHVVIPIQAEHPWPEIKEFAHNFVLAMERDNPSLYLTKMTKAARTGKIYLDYLRNERGATSIAPYSPRARAGMPVCLPLSWSELKSTDRPRFLVSDFSDWKKRLERDPWKTMPTLKQQIKPGPVHTTEADGVASDNSARRSRA